MCVWKSGSAISDFVFLLLIVNEWLTFGYAQVSCPTGDTSGVVSNGQTCAELVTESTMAECYDPTIESACCSSCNALNTGIDGCEFNDRTTCFAFLCPTLVNPADCCATCGSPAPTTATGATSTAATSTAATSTAATSTAATTTQATEPTPATSTTAATSVQSVATTTAVPVTTTTSNVATQSNAATTSIAATTADTTVSDVSTANDSAGALQGSNSSSGKRKDAAIIGGTIGGFLGLVLLASVVGLGVHFINKSKLNKVANFNKESMSPDEDSEQQQHQQPEVVLPSMVPYKATTPNDVITNSHVTDFSENQSTLNDKETPLVSIHEDPMHPEFGTDALLPTGLSAGQGAVMVTKPTALPPLDASGTELISNGGPQTLQNQTQWDASADGINARNDNSVKFLNIEESTFRTEKI